MKRSIVRRVYSRVHPVELLQALIRFDTSGGRERRCIEYIGYVLGQAGVEVRYLALDPERPNLIARIAGRGEAPPLLLYGHVDVVPAEPDGWTRPPFAGDIVDGEVWGRGALDMKGGVAMLVAAVIHAREEPPPGDLVLALTVDEETASRVGMRFLVEHHAELFGGVRFAISEFGGFTQWHGNKRFVPIQVAEKQRCLIRATVRGPGGHAASVVRGTASEKLGRLLGTLASRRLPTHSTPVVRSMVEAMSAALPVHERLSLRALLAPKLTGRLLGLIGAAGGPLEPLLRNTATPTMVHGGTATNVIPTELTVDLDGRVLPGHTPTDLLVELRHLAGGLATFELIEEEPAVAADPDLTLLPLLSEVAREHDPGCVPIPMLLPGYTDARYVSKLGIQTYGFLPMRLPRHLTVGLIHGTDERIPAAALEHGATCLAEMVRRYW